jgi:hypothetical protein
MIGGSESHFHCRPSGSRSDRVGWAGISAAQVPGGRDSVPASPASAVLGAGSEAARWQQRRKASAYFRSWSEGPWDSTSARIGQGNGARGDLRLRGMSLKNLPWNQLPIIPNHAPATNQISGLEAPPRVRFLDCAVSVSQIPAHRRLDPATLAVTPKQRHPRISAGSTVFCAPSN